MFNFLNNITDINLDYISFINKKIKSMNDENYYKYTDNMISILYEYDDNITDDLRLYYEINSKYLSKDYYPKTCDGNTMYDEKIYDFPIFYKINYNLIKLLQTKIKEISYSKNHNYSSDGTFFSLNSCNIYQYINKQFKKYNNLTNDIFNDIIKDKRIGFILSIKLYVPYKLNKYRIYYNVESIIFDNVNINLDGCNITKKPYNFCGENIELEIIDFKNSFYYYNNNDSLEDNIIKLLKCNNIDYQINPPEYNKKANSLNILIDLKRPYNISNFIKNQLLSDIKNEFKIIEKVKNKEYIFNIILNPIKNDYYNMIFSTIKSIILEIKNIDK